MNAERLLQYYGQIADAPDAIARLRRFILDLAVRGKLVPQDPADEPASKLLKRIAAEKASLLNAGKIKKEKPLPSIEDPDFDIPESWQWSRLGIVTSYIQRGKSPKYAASDGALVVSQKCVQWNGLDLSVAKQITLDSLAQYEDVRFVRNNDLLWNSTGTGTIGRVIRIIDPPAKLVCDSHVTVVRCLLVDADYVCLWLRSDHVYALIEGRAAGSTTQVELTAQMALNQIVPLPPFAEQHRIVAKVDELMALCDTLEAARTGRETKRDRLVAASLARLNAPDEETFHDDARFALDALPALTARPDQIKQLRQTILNLAVRGKLVPQDPAAEPAERLLKRIAAERDSLVRQKEIRRDAPLEPVSARDCPHAIPSSWTWGRVGDAVLFTQYGTSQKSHASQSGVPVLTMGNIQDGSVFCGNDKRIPESSDDLPALYLKKFDLLYNRTNSAELVGKTGIYLGQSEARTFASYLIRLRPSLSHSDPLYLNVAMNAPCFRETQIVPLIKKQTGQANVSGSALKNMLIPLPPLAEQHRIVAKVDELMALCDQLETSLTSADETRKKLLDALLAETLARVETVALQEAAE
ncbi:restriction endonuclease subunit S [Rhizobium ruizarguesonis]|uniref:restriction endonuclease subunit S n=1 Tax=Rhizobium ruizarguesonis TaxID=2081791 RepID=UPI00103185D6|nr:restriction endonuclease subunit S [Rhizobium ruizarguesonis]TAU07816.1 restriction endonuclease subunit S [Rhizobium ruizarguesonis]